MRRFLTKSGLAATAVVLGIFIQAGAARAQFIQVYAPPIVVAPRPVISFYPPVTTYYAPPATSYYAGPVASFYSPRVSYSYYPSAPVYAAPVAAPAVVAPGAVATRTVVGYGIFRPRGVYTQNLYIPGGVILP